MSDGCLPGFRCPVSAQVSIGMVAGKGGVYGTLGARCIVNRRHLYREAIT